MNSIVFSLCISFVGSADNVLHDKVAWSHIVFIHGSHTKVGCMFPKYDELTTRFFFRGACKEKYLKKHVSLTAKLFMLFLLGLVGIHTCLLNIDKRISTRKSRISSDIRANEISCHLQTDHSIPFHFLRPAFYRRKECFCTPVHNFVILSMQRSGSGWFETLLNSHPNIISHGEVFLDETRRENFGSIKKILDAIYNLEWNSSASKNECTSAVGFKWMLNQGVMEYSKEALAYFKQNGVSIIFLFRHNLLRRYVSVLANSFDKEAKLLNGTHQSHVHSKIEAQILATYKPVVNVSRLHLYLHRIQEMSNDALFSFKTTRHITVYYEHLLKNSLQIFGIQKFLGVMPRRLTTHQMKIHTKPLSKQIRNWKEVYKRLKGTEFEGFLQD